MAAPDSLVKGNCYFQVGYVDAELLIPVIDTYIFIEEVDKDDQYWLFQDADTFADQSEDSGYLAGIAHYLTNLGVRSLILLQK